MLKCLPLFSKSKRGDFIPQHEITWQILSLNSIGCPRTLRTAHFCSFCMLWLF